MQCESTYSLLCTARGAKAPPGVDVVQRVDHHVKALPEAVVEHILCRGPKIQEPFIR